MHRVFATLGAAAAAAALVLAAPQPAAAQSVSGGEALEVLVETMIDAGCEMPEADLAAAAAAKGVSAEDYERARAVMVGSGALTPASTGDASRVKLSGLGDCP